MMDAKTFLLIALLLCSPALAKEVYEEWVEDGDSWDVGDADMSAMWTGESAFVKYNGESYDIPEGNCQGKGIFDICLLDTRKRKGGDIVPDSINDPSVDVEMLIRVNASIADIKISHMMTRQELQVSEKEKVEVTLENIGGFDAKVEFEEEFPDEVSISNCNLCIIRDNTALWNGTVKAGATTRITYYVTALEDKSFTAKAIASYFNGIEDDSIQSNQKIAVLAPALKIDLDGLGSLDTGMKASVIVNISELDNSVIKIRKLDVTTTQGLKILDKGFDDDDWREFHNYLDFKASVQALESGVQNLTVYVEYESDGVQHALSEHKRYRIESLAKIDTNIEFGPFKAGQPGKAKITIFNPNEEVVNLKATVNSNLTNMSFSKSTIRLGSKNEFTVLDGNLVPAAPGKFYLVVNVSYESQYGEVFNEGVRKEYTVGGKKTGSLVKETREEAENATSLPQKKASNSRRNYTGLVILGIVLIAGMILFYVKYKVKE